MQPAIVNYGNWILTALVVISQILIVIFLIIYFKDRKNPDSKLYQLIEKHALFVAFIVSLVATLGSLFYSEIAGYTPCKFCWFERIFMYPQVFLLGLALKRKEFFIWRYTLPLSIIGGLLALNHYILQLTGTSIIPCSAVGQSISCSKVFVMRLGYITIPLMCLSAFLLMIICMMYIRRSSRLS